MDIPYVFLINPSAGRGKARHDWPAIEQALEQESLPYEVVSIHNYDEAVSQVREWALYPVRAMVAVGGDDTVHAVANGLLQAIEAGAGYLPLGIIPLGTYNDLAAMLEIPIGDPMRALGCIREGRTRMVDVGTLRNKRDGSQRFFINGLGVGLDALLLTRGLYGKDPSSLGTLLQLMQRYRAVTPTFTYNGLTRTMPVTMLTVGNGRSHAGLKLLPDAALDDAQLDICLVRALPRRAIPSFLQEIAEGEHTQRLAVTIERAERFWLSSKSPIPMQVDNSFYSYEGGELEIGVAPAWLPVLY